MLRFSFLILLCLHILTAQEQPKFQFSENQINMDNKMILLKANEAVAKGDYETFLNFCTEDIRWNLIGEQVLQGKDEIRRYMNDIYIVPPVFTTESILSDGNFVVVTGTISLQNTNGQYHHYHYCDIWRFEGDKMAELKAFVIEK